jgi:hypothetical protein
VDHHHPEPEVEKERELTRREHGRLRAPVPR